MGDKHGENGENGENGEDGKNGEDGDGGESGENSEIITTLTDHSHTTTHLWSAHHGTAMLQPTHMVSTH